MSLEAAMFELSSNLLAARVPISNNVLRYCILLIDSLIGLVENTHRFGSAICLVRSFWRARMRRMPAKKNCNRGIEN